MELLDEQTHLDNNILCCDTRLGGYEQCRDCDKRAKARSIGRPREWGMRLKDTVTSRCVCFPCVQSGDRYVYGGTGSFVSVPSEKFGKEVRYGYLVYREAQ